MGPPVVAPARRAQAQRPRGWTKWLAAAAMLAVAFLGGLLWNRSNTGPVARPRTTPPTDADPASKQTVEPTPHPRNSSATASCSSSSAITSTTRSGCSSS